MLTVNSPPALHVQGACYHIDHQYWVQLLGTDLWGLPEHKDAPPTLGAAALSAALRSGSDATALDGLPRSLLAALPWSTLQLLWDLVEAGRNSASDLIWTALLLPLKKKEPTWLLRNSRPVLLEAPLLRAAATAAFRDLMHRLETTGCLPAEMMAYRRGISIVHGALLIRWLLEWWTPMHDVYPTGC